MIDDNGGSELKDNDNVGRMKEEPSENKLLTLPFIMELNTVTNNVYDVST